MPRTEIVLQAFVASPSDTANERLVLENVIRELNATWRKTLGISIDLLKWETHAIPGAGVEPQAIINSYIGDDYDIFIGLMWGRFGTATKNYESGTEEEFRRAYERWERDNGSVHIMFYFNDEAIVPSKIDTIQLQKIQNFKTILGDEGNLYWHYQGEDHFSQLVRMHLSRVIQKWIPTPQPLPEIGDSIACAKPNAEEADIGGTVISNLIKDCTDEAGTAMDEDDEDIGYLDLMESLEDSIFELNDIATRMAEATDEVGAAMNSRTEELEKLKIGGQAVDFRGGKRIINLASQDLDRFTSRLEVDIVDFSKCNLNIANCSTLLAGMLARIGSEEGEELEKLIEILGNLIGPLESLPDNVKIFRDTISNMPRATIRHNKSRKSAVRALDELLTSIDRSFSVCVEARSVIQQMLKKRGPVIDI